MSCSYLLGSWIYFQITSRLQLLNVWISFAVTDIKDFHVVASDMRPPAKSGYNFDHYGYRMCAQYEGVPEKSSPSPVWCEEEAIGRYVYIYNKEKSALHFCEVEVFGIRKCVIEWYMTWY